LPVANDATKNAEDLIQDINNPSESDEEDREPPVHIAGTSSERKSSAASDASTSPKTRKKVKTDRDNSTQQSKTGFDQRCDQLLRFKEEECGHSNVPTKYAGNASFGHWCMNMRTAYKKKQKEMKTKSNLSQDRVEQLEEIGFQWQVLRTGFSKIFEKR